MSFSIRRKLGRNALRRWQKTAPRLEVPYSSPDAVLTPNDISVGCDATPSSSSHPEKSG